MQDSKNNYSIISYLAAIAPALLQLIAVVSVGLVNVLRLNEFVLAPSFINIANFLVILLSLSIISLASFWDRNRFALTKNTNHPFSDTKAFWNVLKFCCALAIIGFLIFVGIIIYKQQITSNIEFWTFVQWTTYIISMTSVSFIIYAFALLKIQEHSSRNLNENYVPRLIDSLRRFGHLKNPEVIIDSINRDRNEAIVRFEGGPKHRVISNYNGDMISIERVV